MGGIFNRPSIVDQGEAWAQRVVDGEEIACKWIKLACKRHFSDKKNADELDLYFDAEEVERVGRWYELHPHTKGPLTAQLAIKASNDKRRERGLRPLPYVPIELTDWQAFMVLSLYGWRRWSDEAAEMFFATRDAPKSWPRRFQTGHVSVGRKNGKTTGAGPLCTYELAAAGEGGAEVYSAATTRDQARIIFDIVAQMVKRGALKTKLKPMRNALPHIRSGSTFKPLSSDYDTLDGLNGSFFLIDELHAHKSAGLYEVCQTSSGARKSPLLLSITTAGVDIEGICYETEQYGKKVLEGVVSDESFFMLLFTADEDDLEDELALFEPCPAWYKANPNLGVSVSLEKLRDQAKAAAATPRKRAQFKRYRLNVWTKATQAWIDAADWQACPVAAPIDELRARECYIGLDLADKKDIASACVMFAGASESGSLVPVAHWRHWIPEAAIDSLGANQARAMRAWAEAGHITVTDGKVCDQELIETELLDMRDELNVQALAFDPWHATRLVQNLHGEGWPEEQTIQIGQTIKHMSEPMKQLEAWVIDHTLEHSHCPVAGWAMSNVVAWEDRSGNMRPNREGRVNKIDPAVACIMASSRLLFTVPKKPSVYEQRGMRQL